MHQSLSKNPYENYKILGPQGNLMFLTNFKKVKWYINRNLAKKIDSNTYQLTFQPAGGGSLDPVLLQLRKNICVVCGTDQDLTMHHIVPKQYRKLMPDFYSSHDHYDIQPLCKNCHKQCEVFNNKLKAKLHYKFGIKKLDREIQDTNIRCRKAISQLYSIKEYGDKIPEDVKMQMLVAIAQVYGQPIEDLSDFQEIINTLNDKIIPEYQRSLLFEKYTNYQKFIEMWRRFFIRRMQPQFLPEGWKTNRIRPK